MSSVLSNGQDSDSALMCRIASGDRKAFCIFVRRHGARCVAVARRIVANPSDAEDTVQEAWLRVWEHAGAWHGTSSRATTWLHRIVINVAIDRVRKKSPAYVSVEEGPLMVDPAPSAHLLLEARELEGRIAKEIRRLPARQRDALSLCYFEGLSCAEAAHAMRISVSAMEALLVRARRTLRERLAASDTRRIGSPQQALTVVGPHVAMTGAPRRSAQDRTRGRRRDPLCSRHASPSTSRGPEEARRERSAHRRSADEDRIAAAAQPSAGIR